MGLAVPYTGTRGVGGGGGEKKIFVLRTSSNVLIDVKFNRKR